MSAIPPHSIASILQGHAAQNRAAEARQRERAAESAAHDASRPHPLTDAIANDERDSDVYADSEGAGSQGRAGSRPDDQPAQDGSGPPGAGLDIEA